MAISASDMNYIIALFAVMIVSFTVIMLFGIARTLYWRKEESNCPSCGQYWARQVVGEELVDTYRRIFSVQTLIAGALNHRQIGRVFTHKKYKLYHRCKYCMHEWTSILVKLER